MTAQTMRPTTLEEARSLFVRYLEGNNRSQSTIVNYTIDLTQFMAFLQETNPLLISPTDVIKSDISEYTSWQQFDRSPARSEPAATYL
jgi:site-specific recombinase XerD